MLNGNTKSGIYIIALSSDEFQTLDVYCHMETDGGG